jgi:hypothetical protein
VVRRPIAVQQAAPVDGAIGLSPWLLERLMWLELRGIPVGSRTIDIGTVREEEATAIKRTMVNRATASSQARGNDSTAVPTEPVRVSSPRGCGDPSYR